MAKNLKKPKAPKMRASDAKWKDFENKLKSWNKQQAEKERKRKLAGR